MLRALLPFSWLILAAALLGSAPAFAASAPHRESALSDSFRPTATVGATAPTPNGLSALDWEAIRKAYEASRHAVYTDENELFARNPGQRWVAQFDARGSLVRPDAGSWNWGLELVHYGFPGMERPVGSPLRLNSEGSRAVYGWDETIDEWYINDVRGLEHGYTVHRRPPMGEFGALGIRLKVRGGLRPEVSSDGRDAHFVDDAGNAIVTYTGLTVIDATGRVLPAHLEALPAGLHLKVDDRGAHYPITIDPIVQQAYLKASNTGAGDDFGDSVSISGNTVVVGAKGESSSATGVNGNQADNSAANSGAAYVFVRSGTTWSMQAYLKASNTDPDDYFGSSVAISGDTVVVGAPFEAFGTGAAYVFVRNGASWSQQAYLKASNADGGDRFGWSVAISNNTLVVSAILEDSNAVGVNGNRSDNSALDSGAVYVFERLSGLWSEQAYLKASNSESFDLFGISTSISGNTVVVGSENEASSATGINGNEADNSAGAAGAAYVFSRSAAVWSQEAYLKASNTDAIDEFGSSVSVSGDTIVVGAWRENSSATGVNGNQADNSAASAGAVYVFLRSAGIWNQEAYLKASNTNGGDRFGSSVAISGNTAVVGAQGEASSAPGVNGNQADNSANSAGAAYVFSRSGGVWSQDAYLKASNTDASDYFGHSVAVSGETVVVGAHQEASSATGVNGNDADNSAPSSGAAYVFEIPPPPDECPISFCPSPDENNLASIGRLTLFPGTTSAVSDNDLGFDLDSQCGVLTVSNIPFPSDPFATFSGTLRMSPPTSLAPGELVVTEATIRNNTNPASGIPGGSLFRRNIPFACGEFFVPDPPTGTLVAGSLAAEIDGTLETNLSSGVVSGTEELEITASGTSFWLGVPPTPPPGDIVVSWVSPGAGPAPQTMLAQASSLGSYTAGLGEVRLKMQIRLEPQESMHLPTSIKARVSTTGASLPGFSPRGIVLLGLWLLVLGAWLRRPKPTRA